MYRTCFVAALLVVTAAARAVAQPPPPTEDAAPPPPTPAVTTPVDENRPWIGVSLDPGYSAGGARVSRVHPSSPALRAGLRPGDVVLAVNGVDIADDQQLIQAISEMIPNTSADLLVYRDGQSITLNTAIGRKQNAVAVALPAEERATPVINLTAPTRVEISSARLTQLGERIYRLERMMEDLQRELQSLREAQLQAIGRTPAIER